MAGTTASPNATGENHARVFRATMTATITASRTMNPAKATTWTAVTETVEAHASESAVGGEVEVNDDDADAGGDTRAGTSDGPRHTGGDRERRDRGHECPSHHHAFRSLSQGSLPYR